MAIQGAINTILGTVAGVATGLSKTLGGGTDTEKPESETNGSKDEEMRAKALKTAQQKINAVYKTNMAARNRNAVIKDILSNIK